MLSVVEQLRIGLSLGSLPLHGACAAGLAAAGGGHGGGLLGHMRDVLAIADGGRKKGRQIIFFWV